MKNYLKNNLYAIAGSYSQVFFSNSPWLALFLVAASFLNPVVGLSGLLSVIFAILVSEICGLKSEFVLNGLYTYNALLSGMAIASFYNFNGALIALLLLFSALSLFISVWMASFMGRHRIPFLSLPFIICVWIFLLNSQIFMPGLLHEKMPFSAQQTGWPLIHKLSSAFLHLPIPKIIMLYFKSMASIFFQDSALAGLLISVGLIISSRIAFFLSWLGFISGYLFFRLSVGETIPEVYLNTGFNYIFSALALAGFYMVSSTGSFIFVILTAPIIFCFSTALQVFIGPYQLPLYSMPFSLAVIMLLSVLHNRVSFKFLHLVQYQLYSPEKNLYAFHIYTERFRRDTYLHIHLPFFGEWTVSQGHTGEQTHRENWKYALDFVVSDEHNKTFKLPGDSLADFYCYSLPVIAPADGYVVKVVNDVEDNALGDVNLNENWGNTVIIKHGEFIYSKTSHLKKDSILVKAGDYIRRGELMAQCGNSGRSPEPHIHFQLQATPYIGAHTIYYPLSYYITKKSGRFSFHSFEIPEKGDILLRPTATPLVKEAFHFIPGMKLQFETEGQGEKQVVQWEVITDAYNQTYIYCHNSGSKAFLSYNDAVFYFTGFSGNKQSLLYYFYMAAYKIALCYFPGLEIKDYLPVESMRNNWLKPVQDFIAPFYIFMRPVYASVFRESKDSLFPAAIIIESSVSWREAGSSEPLIRFELELSENRVNKITVREKHTCLIARNIG